MGGLGATLYRRGISLLMRLAVAGMLAVVAAIALGAVATGGGLVQLLVTLLAAVALWIPAFLLVSAFARMRRRRRERAALAKSATSRPAQGAPSSTGEIDTAWNGLAAAAGRRQAEVRRLENQLAAVWQALPTQTLDPQVHELQLLIGKRIPQLIETRLACLPLRRAEREAAVDELLTLLSDFAEDSVGRYERLAIGSRERHAVVRRRIEQHLDRDGFSSLT